MKKLLVFCFPEWAFGQIHNALGEQLRARGWAITFRDWRVSHPNLAAEAAQHDHILTVCSAGEVGGLVAYGVPKHRITLVAHAEEDIQTFIKAQGAEGFKHYAGYGVVSDSLACSSLALGVTRIPLVVRLGVDVEKYRLPPAKELRTVGYAARWERKTLSGLEQKRGALAKACADEAGLAFKATENTPMEAMPNFYASIDALIMPSLQEGAGLPALEAAAAGRLVIGTPVGHFPRLCYEGLGILGPLDARAFQRFTVERLRSYKEHPQAFWERCTAAQLAANTHHPERLGRDWRHVVEDWIELLEAPRGG